MRSDPTVIIRYDDNGLIRADDHIIKIEMGADFAYFRRVDNGLHYRYLVGGHGVIVGGDSGESVDIPFGRKDECILESGLRTWE